VPSLRLAGSKVRSLFAPSVFTVGVRDLPPGTNGSPAVSKTAIPIAPEPGPVYRLKHVPKVCLVARWNRMTRLFRTIWALAIMSGVMELTGDVAQLPAKVSGLTIELSLLDFMIVQRALIDMKDEKAQEVLQSIRRQIVAQMR
jgi:hypothetical protein